jgi:hypothetical protein
VFVGKEQQRQAAAVTAPTVGYSADLEKRRVEFEMKKIRDGDGMEKNRNGAREGSPQGRNEV